jgi:hypothetical protein
MNSVTTLLKLEAGTQYDYAPVTTRVIDGERQTGRWRCFRVEVLGVALDQETKQERVIYRMVEGVNGPMVPYKRWFEMTLSRFAAHFLPLEEKEEVKSKAAEPIPEKVLDLRSQSKIG